MSRTKIVATNGPANQDPEVLLGMMRAGMDVLRLNISHLNPDEIAGRAAQVRALAMSEDLPIAILADMPGPKIRCTACEPKVFILKDGDTVLLSPSDDVTTPERICVPYPHLLEDVEVGHEAAINDGLVLIRIEAKDEANNAFRCVVINGGEISSRKGVSFPHSSLRITSLTPRDYEGLKAAAAANVDFIALSFVRYGSDILEAKKVLEEAGNPKIPIVAKIEQHEAIDHMEDILSVADGVMVARGDMGIERPLEQVPLMQKDLIRRCNELGRFVITATQMLESMTEHARPTRAEVSDVANAILDGTDAVMLSGETAAGKNPVLTVATMDRIAQEAEKRIDPSDRLSRLPVSPERPGQDVNHPSLDDALAHAACELALGAKLDALVCFSFHGTTARRVARYRPACPVYVLSPYEQQFRRLALTWGVETFAFPEAQPAFDGHQPHPSELIAPAIHKLRSMGLLEEGSRVGFLAGVPFDKHGGTNWLQVVVV
jgi:pyruvate kinase